DPDGAGALAVIIDIVLVQLKGGCNLIVPVDGHRLERQGSGGPGYKRSFQVAEQNRGGVHLAVVDGKAQSGGVDLAVVGVGRQGIVEQDGAVLQGQGLALAPAQAGTQAQGLGFVQLRRRERAAQGGDVIAQQAERCGAGFFQ